MTWSLPCSEQLRTIVRDRSDEIFTQLGHLETNRGRDLVELWWNLKPHRFGELSKLAESNPLGEA